MVVYVTNGCVSCGKEPCLGKYCPNTQEHARFFCDACGEEEDLFKFEGQQLCKNCLAGNFELVEEQE